METRERSRATAEPSAVLLSLPKEVKIEIGKGQTRLLVEQLITLDTFEVLNIQLEPIDKNPNIGTVVEGKVIVQGTATKEISLIDRQFERADVTERVPFTTAVENWHRNSLAQAKNRFSW
ncbi:MAG: hypothetical protein AB1497_11240 [Bacillota bacterium]